MFLKNSAYFKERKQSLKEGEAVLVLDFAENYSFVVQDAAQGFHWNNSQATIHPFVFYYYDRATQSVKHKSYACISDHMTHDTAAVYVFQEYLINKLIKLDFPEIQKIIYFSDGSSAQYKNRKNFTNLIHHENDFGIKAEWHFFATSHGKNACDGVGGTIKCLAARASLQRAVSDQILTPKQLFEFTTKEIDGGSAFYIDTNSVDTIARFLEPRFSKSVTFKGTRRNHKFIPCSGNITMSFVSGNRSLPCLLLQSNASTMSVEDILPGSYYACKYDNDWYFCVANYVSVEHSDVNVKFLHPKGPASQFFWPKRDDTCWIPTEHIIKRVDPPSSGSTGRCYSFSSDDIRDIQSSI